MNRLQTWIKVRKNTVYSHWLYGLLCGLVAGLYFPGGVALLVLFAVLEAWNDHCEDKREGCTDWWDAFIVFSGTFAVIVILHLIGVISIRWI